MVTVKRSDLEDAYEFVSGAQQGESNTYICRETGKIYYQSVWTDTEEDLPEDVDDASKYTEVPHKKELDLGSHLVFRFAESEMLDDYDDVRAYFSKRGAYARFKDLLVRRGKLEAWYAYEENATTEALKEWCAENDIQLVDG